jgi:hypothetical protein
MDSRSAAAAAAAAQSNISGGGGSSSSSSSKLKVRSDAEKAPKEANGQVASPPSPLAATSSLRPQSETVATDKQTTENPENAEEATLITSVSNPPPPASLQLRDSDGYLWYELPVVNQASLSATEYNMAVDIRTRNLKISTLQDTNSEKITVVTVPEHLMLDTAYLWKAPRGALVVRVKAHGDAAISLDEHEASLNAKGLAKVPANPKVVSKISTMNLSSKSPGTQTPLADVHNQPPSLVTNVNGRQKEQKEEEKKMMAPKENKRPSVNADAPCLSAGNTQAAAGGNQPPSAVPTTQIGDARPEGGKQITKRKVRGDGGQKEQKEQEKKAANKKPQKKQRLKDNANAPCNSANNTVPQAAAGSYENSCHICFQEVGEDDDGVGCDGCDRWFHSDCITSSKFSFRFLWEGIPYGKKSRLSCFVCNDCGVCGLDRANTSAKFDYQSERWCHTGCLADADGYV